jgi:hypothetical protein
MLISLKNMISVQVVLVDMVEHALTDSMVTIVLVHTIMVVTDVK